MIEDAIDAELIEDAMEAVDLVLLWWRDEDGDLVDGLVDALPHTDGGYIWLMTPKVGRSGYVDAADLAEAAVTAGLALTNSVHVSSDLDRHQTGTPQGFAPVSLGARPARSGPLYGSQPAWRAAHRNRAAWCSGGDHLLSMGVFQHLPQRAGGDS